MAGEEAEEIWTTENDGNEPKRNISRVSTASAKNQKKILNQNNNNNITNNNDVKAANATFVGVQSRFQRKYYHKTLLVVLLFLIILLSMTLLLVLFYGKHRDTLCETKDCLRAASNLLQSMDFSVNPCDDFYQFTCGNWAEDHPRPDSVSSFDWFSEKQTKILRFIRTFLQSNGTAKEPKAVNQTRIMYRACMDTAQMDAIGLQPVTEYLQLFHLPNYPTIIDKETGKNITFAGFDWIQSIAIIKKTVSADIIFGFDIFPDPTNRTRNRIVLGTPETTSVLPFKTDYERKLVGLLRKRISEFDASNFVKLGEDIDDGVELKDKDDETINAYTMYMTEVMSAFVFFTNPSVNLELILPTIKESAVKIIKTTKFLIELSDEAENVTKNDAAFAADDLINLNLDDFQNTTDHLITPKTLPIWHQYLSIIYENVTDPPMDFVNHLVLTGRADMYYLQHVIQYILDMPEIELELYIWWTIVEELVLHTTSDIRKLHNDYAKSITNLEGSTPRSLYCTSGVNQLMGMAVSYAIAQPDFLIDTKPKVMTMIQNIRMAFDNLVREINWMDVGTKCSTLEKSRAMKSFIGFPEWIVKDDKLDQYYGGLNFNATTHLKNLIDVLKWQMMEKLKTLNETEELGWATTPTNVNAFHTFQANAITVPLAILQYPFYNLGLEALNYGAIGTILGHELTHGFDDSGRQFDKNGNMRQWWTNKTIAEYINRTDCFIKQYSSYYIPEIDDHIDGELTLGENIADNGGLREAYYAYQLFVDKYGKERMLPGLERFTHEQLLFISFGNLWCETQTTIATKWALEDTHCPGRIRLKGVIANSNEFDEAFHCKANLKKQSQKRCRIW